MVKRQARQGDGDEDDEAALVVVDLIDAIGQCGCERDQPLEAPVLATLLRVSACEDLPDSMRALAGRLVAEHLARSSPTTLGAEGRWLIH